jgi:hypothetical protein
MKRHGRTWIVIVLGVILLVPMGIAFGLTRTLSVNGSQASCLDWAAIKSPTTTTSTTWTDVPGMRVTDVLAENFAAQVSGTFDGSDVQLRVLDKFVGGTFPLAPGSTTTLGSSGPTAFSFTWVGTNPAEHQHTLQLQWRLPSAGSATMTAGDMTLLYQGAPTPATC